MANPEHLEILKQGVEVWNRWREEHPGVAPDLGGAHLKGAHLADANLERTDLDGAKLEKANLRRARLSGASLQKAHLFGADLEEANLVGSNLEGANLRTVHCWNARFESATLKGANLMDANLTFARLENADLRAADLTGTILRGSELANVDLSEADVGTILTRLSIGAVRGLRTVRHVFASDISTDVLERTAQDLGRDPSRQGEIEAFYRGAGVPEHLIDYYHSQIGAIHFYSCFISHSHQDQSFARRIHDQLQARGIRCWLDEHDLNPGDRILDVVYDAIRLHDKILFCCSEASLESWWVKDEIRKAMERERLDGRDIIIPLIVDRYLLDGWEDGLAADLRSRLAADFTGWEHDNSKFEEQFERVVKALRTDERTGSIA